MENEMKARVFSNKAGCFANEVALRFSLRLRGPLRLCAKQAIRRLRSAQRRKGPRRRKEDSYYLVDNRHRVDL